MKKPDNEKSQRPAQMFVSSKEAQSEQGTSVQGIYMSSDPEAIHRLQMLFEKDGISLEKVFADMLDRLKEKGLHE